MRRVFLISLLVLLMPVATAGAVTLVTPEGAPLPGPWQGWANESRMPTGDFQLVIQPALACPSGFCSTGPVPPLPPGTPWTSDFQPPPGMPPSEQQSQMLFELGHQVDWHLLTPGDRERLARLWRDPQVPWFDSLTAADANSEDGLEADFSYVFMSCALGQPALPPKMLWPDGDMSPWAHVQPNGCAAIAKMLGGKWRPLRAYRWLLYEPWVF